MKKNALALMGAMLLGVTVVMAVEQNCVFETSFTSSKAYDNPFMEVEVDVLFSNGAQEWKVPAFWDGGKTWTLEPEMGNYYGEHYQALLRLTDGRLLLTFTVRSLKPPLGVQAVLGVETKDGFVLDFKKDRLILDEKTPADQSSGGGFGGTVQLEDDTLVTAYSYRGADSQFHVEVVRWRLP